jgi:hypothetical protein
VIVVSVTYTNLIDVLCCAVPCCAVLCCAVLCCAVLVVAGGGGGGSGGEQKGKVMGTVIELETQPCGVVIIDKSIIVGCMDNVLHSFHFKGKKNYSIYLPEPITNLTLLHLKRIHAVKALLVALANGEVRLYNKKHLIATIKSEDVVTGTCCWWGQR